MCAGKKQEDVGAVIGQNGDHRGAAKVCETAIAIRETTATGSWLHDPPDEGGLRVGVHVYVARRTAYGRLYRVLHPSENYILQKSSESIF